MLLRKGVEVYVYRIDKVDIHSDKGDGAASWPRKKGIVL